MQKMSALQFAERGRCSQIRAFSGDVLYTEGMSANHMYVVKEGEVDLYLIRDEKRVVIETLKRGQCFGVEPHLANHTRVHNAAARTYCELYLIDDDEVFGAIEASPDLPQSILDTLSNRLSVAHELIATRVNYQPDLVIYAQMLYLLGIAEVGKQAVKMRGGASDTAPPLAKPLLQEVMVNARLLFGHSDKHILGCIGKLVRLHIVRVEDERGAGKQVIFSPRDIVGQVRKAVNTDVDNEKLTYEYISIDEFAGLVEADRTLVLKKLASGEFADDVFTFRRAEILSLLNKKGKRYFLERKIKPPSEFSEISDVEFVDNKSIFAIVSKFDTYDLAKLLSTMEQGVARDKILNALSRRKREEVDADLKDMPAVDPMDAQQIGTALINELKALLLQQAK